MSKGNRHIRSDMIHERIGGNTGKQKPGVFKESKFIKKAGVTIEYENYNTKKKADKQVYK